MSDSAKSLLIWNITANSLDMMENEGRNFIPKISEIADTYSQE